MLKLAEPRSGMFVDFASDGLLIGSAALIEAHRITWLGDGATLLMFAEGRELRRGSRHLKRASSRIGQRPCCQGSRRDHILSGCVRTALKHSLKACRTDRPLHRPGLLGSSTELATLASLTERFDDASVTPATFSEPFFEHGPYSGVTTARSGSRYLVLARGRQCAFDDRPQNRSPPPPSSMKPGRRGRPKAREWIWVCYITGDCCSWP